MLPGATDKTSKGVKFGSGACRLPLVPRNGMFRRPEKVLAG